MKVFRAGFLPVFFLLMAFSGFSQEWVRGMEDPDVNFYDVQQSFNSYWEGKEIEKGKGWKQFRRWEYFMEQRVYPHGDRNVMVRAMESYMRDELRSSSGSIKTANWTLIGPSSTIPSGGGAGRINALRFHPSDPNTLFACAPAGGLWKSVNGGASWSSNTDNLAVIGVSDVAIHPFNPNIMYLATGDGDAGDTYSIGVLKSTDGGNSWSPSGLSWTVNQTNQISKLLIHPTNPDTVLAATDNGIYRTVNGGATWTQTSTGSYKDMEFKPGDPSTVYIAGTSFRRSTNTGGSFTTITTGLPSGVSRFAIAVTANDAGYVYILAGDGSNQGFEGLYRSTNSGASFSTMSTSPNLLGWSNSGSDSGGQAWYDLALAASPLNKNEVWVGGVNIWRSLDGGSTWSIKGHWYGAGSTPYVHADIHDLIFVPGSSTLYSANDGGVFKTTNGGTSWSDLSNGLQIAQMYRLSTAATNAQLNLSGWQDNGSNRVNNGVWTEVYGGDGMECIVDPTSASTMYVSLYYGEVFKSTDGGNNFNNITNSGGSGVDADGAWVTPYILSPSSNSTVFIGKSQVYKSTNGGASFSQVGTLSGGSGKVIALANAASNANYIYAAKSNKLWVSTDGSTFTDRTSGLPVSSASITYISINPSDPTEAWVTFSGYSSNNKVYHTTNSGVSWTNFTTGLPNLPVNCIVYQYGTNDGLYVGTDVGVYYRENGMTSWTAYNTGLPNVIVNELEIHYGSGKLRAATFGRGMWESPLYSPGTMVPLANFNASTTSGCPGTTVQFSDISSFSPSSWSWTFPGGTPSSSTLQNPVVVYPNPGSYNVTLVAGNINGNGTETKTSYINITTPQALPLSEGFQQISFPPVNWSIDNADNSATWHRTTQAGGFGNTTASMVIDNFNSNLGSDDALITNVYDLNGATSISLTFDVAYAPYSSAYSDSLAVFASTDCGVTFNKVYQKGGVTLSTAPSTSSLFIPTSTQWRNETVTLSSISGTLILKFLNIGGYGNQIFVDNINLGAAGVAPVAGFDVNPVSICEGSQISFFNQSGNFPTSYNWSFPGGTPTVSAQQNPVVTYTSAGTYQATLTVTNSFGSDAHTTQVQVNPFPAKPVISVINGDLVSSALTGNQWKLFGGTISGATNQVYTPQTNGFYSVEVTSTAGCSTSSDVYDIKLGVEESVFEQQVSIVPNPAKDRFAVRFITASEQQLTIEVLDAAGRLLKMKQQQFGPGQGEMEFTLEGFANGLYLVRGVGAEGSFTRKLVVAR